MKRRQKKKRETLSALWLRGSVSCGSRGRGSSKPHFHPAYSLDFMQHLRNKVIFISRTLLRSQRMDSGGSSTRACRVLVIREQNVLQGNTVYSYGDIVGFSGSRTVTPKRVFWRREREASKASCGVVVRTRKLFGLVYNYSASERRHLKSIRHYQVVDSTCHFSSFWI